MSKNTNDAHNPNKKEIGRKKKRLIEARKKAGITTAIIKLAETNYNWGIRKAE